MSPIAPPHATLEAIATMSDRCCGPDHTDIEPTRPLLTRRRVLAAGAVTGATVAFGGLPALGQTTPDGDGTTTSTTDGTTTTSSTTTSTTTTTTTAPAPAPAPTTPPTTTAPPRTPEVATPVHPDDDPIPEALDGFDTLLSTSPDRGIMFPVFPNSATSWVRTQDTYGACRSGCSRRHQGEDLMGKNGAKGAKLVAVKAGTVVELRHRSSGNSLYIRGDDGWFYCYLHINNDRPGTNDGSNLVANAWGPGLLQFKTGTTTMNETAARGYRVKQGEVVAYMGNSGNAESAGSHLHFEIRQPATGTYSSETQRLWSSASVNPRVSLQNAVAAREASMVPPETFQPWTTSEAFITYQFRDFLGRAPSSSDLAYYRDQLDYGTNTPDWMVQILLESAECDSKTQCVARLYQAFYKRLPDSAGFIYWLDKRRGPGWGVDRIAEQFSRAPEFRTMYGSLTNGEYVELVYRNVLNRKAEPDGLAYWRNELDRGRINRGRMMTLVSESPENKTVRRNAMHVIAAYGVMLNRMPTSSEHSTWTGLLDHPDPSQRISTRDMIVMLRMTDEYRAIVGAA